jgi:hypothetical protein
MNSKIFSLVPTNGTEFVGKLGQKIIFEVEPSIGLLKARESYLVLNVLNTSSDFSRTTLNNMAGVSSLISRVDIYSLKSGQHLETMENYDLWSAVEHQYLYQDKTNLRAMEGVGADCYANNANAGNTTQVAPVAADPSALESNLLSPCLKNGDAKYNFRQFITPLKCGIMRYWDDEKLVPLLNLLGLRIEITLQDPKICLQTLNARTTPAGVPTLNSIASTLAHADATFAFNNNDGTDQFITSTANCSINDCGFAVGNSITIMSTEVAAGETKTITAIELVGSACKISFGGAQGALGGARTGVKVKHAADTRAYKVKPEFRVVSVQPPAGEVGSLVRGINYQFTTYDLFFNTIPSSVRKHQIEIPSVATKAQCLMTFIHTTSGEQDEDSSSYYTNSIPDNANLNLNSIQYHIDGRLIPVRAYNPKHKAEKIIAQHEVAKALSTINREPQDLGNADAQNLEQYTNTFMLARELARPPYVYPLAEAEPQIRLGFSANTGSSFTSRTLVWSKKVVVADPTSGIKVLH